MGIFVDGLPIVASNIALRLVKMLSVLSHIERIELALITFSVAIWILESTLDKFTPST